MRRIAIQFVMYTCFIMLILSEGCATSFLRGSSKRSLSSTDNCASVLVQTNEAPIKTIVRPVDIVEMTVSMSENPYHSSRTYEYLEQNSDFVKQFISRNFKKRIVKESGLKFRTWSENDLKKLQGIMGDRDFALLVDPGVMSRLNEFLKFRYDYRKQNPETDALSLRAAFSKQVGTMKVYRGLSGEGINLEKAKDIFFNGMDANFYASITKEVNHLKNQPAARVSRENSFYNFWYGAGPLGEINQKSNTLEFSLMMPVSRHKSVAETFAENKSGAAGYLFTLEIPEIDVYDYTLRNSIGWDFTHPLKKHRRMYRNNTPPPEVESFVFAQIPPEYIKKFVEWFPPQFDSSYNRIIKMGVEFSK